MSRPGCMAADPSKACRTSCASEDTGGSPCHEPRPVVDDPAYLLVAAERRKREGIDAPLNLSLDEQITLLTRLVAGRPAPDPLVGEWHPDGVQCGGCTVCPPRRLVLPQYPDDMPIEFHPEAMWLLPNDATFEVIHPQSLEDAYALLHAAAVRIWRECLELRERWANNTEPAHTGAAIPRAVAYQYVAGQLSRAIAGARALHTPKEHP